jgi:hypothetical protein
MDSVLTLFRQAIETSVSREKKMLSEALDSSKSISLLTDATKMAVPVTDADRKKIMNLPQHFPNGETNPEWLAYRKGVVTGSRIAKVSGNGFGGQNSLVKGMIFPGANKVNRLFCDYGLQNEPVCEQKLAEYLQSRVSDPLDPLASFEIKHYGLVKETNCVGYSPDGVVVETYSDGSSAAVLAEFKCPYTKRNFKSDDVFGVHYYEKEKPCLYGPCSVPPVRKKGTMDTDYLKKNPHAQLLPITAYYYDQVQWGMEVMAQCGILKTQATHSPRMFCYFVVFTPRYTQVSKIPFDEGYAKYLKTIAYQFLETKYFPALKQLVSETEHTHASNDSAGE